jgi:hypothetical protein
LRHGKYGGGVSGLTKQELKKRQFDWINDCCGRILCLFALDRYEDYSDDKVILNHFLLKFEKNVVFKIKLKNMMNCQHNSQKSSFKLVRTPHTKKGPFFGGGGGVFF